MNRDSLFGFGATAVEAYRARLMAKLALGAGKKGLKALDLGCGEGHEAVSLAALGYQVEAVDREPHPAWKSLGRGSGVRFSTGDAQSMKRPSGSYDLVYEKDMLHHAADPVAALKEMARLAKPGGKVVVVEANLWNPIFYLHLTLMEGHRHFSRRRLAWLLREAGCGDAAIRVLEVRVWPVNRSFWQSFLNRLQDLAEAIPPLRPFLCYHLAVWQKPVASRRPAGRARV